MPETESLEALAKLPASDLISWAGRTFPGRFAVVTAFQPEGLVVVDLAFAAGHKPRIITVDTGRLPQETYEMMDAVRRRYGVAVEVVSPDAGEVERMVARHGVNLFREEVPLRKLCCQIRKVRPLQDRLASVSAWASGLRREQSEERSGLKKLEQDGPRLKLNPLADWTDDDVRQYTRAHGLPRHPLLLAGYATVGCAPCTRAVEEGEDARAGRWWWEQDGAGKECGIHATPTGQLRRTLDVLLDEILH